MLVHQGAIAFEIWTGRDAPVDIMRQTLLSVLNVREGMQADEAK
jgi:shikimate 5-dehydrogenase